MKKLAFLNEFSIEAIRDAIEKLDAFENLKVNGLTAGELEQVRSVDPELYAAIGEKIKADRWFPCAGLWNGGDGKFSDSCLVRNMLYSYGYFKQNFGKEYVTFQGDIANGENFAQLLYSAGFDACLLAGEGETCWLCSKDGSRVLLCTNADSVDVTDLDDDFIKDNEFVSADEYVQSVYDSPLDLKARLCEGCTPEADEEKLLLEAEKITAKNGENKAEEIKNCWISLFGGEDVTRAAEKLINGRKFDGGFIKINSTEVELRDFKFAEDMSGDRVIRLRETAGSEKSLTVMCDEINAAFRCEIIPYEIQTFRVDKDGFAEETMITE